MASAKYTTLGEGTLASSMDGSTTTLSLSSGQGAKFPSSGDFWLVVDDEVMKCTSRSTDTLTVVRAQDSTSAASHSSGAAVTEVITSNMLDQLRQDYHRTGTLASASSEKAGDLYLPSDSIYIARDNGSNYNTRWGPVWNFPNPPENQTWTWENQGSATVDTSRGGVYLVAPASATYSTRIRKKAIPSAPYTITCCLMPNLYRESEHSCGLLLRESSSGKMVGISLWAPNTMYSEQWNSSTSWGIGNATLSSFEVASFGRPVWLRWQDDNTNRKSYYSMDGRTFHQMYSTGRTSFITPDEVAVYANSANANHSAAVWILDYVEA